jgi:hypothetical protein
LGHEKVDTPGIMNILEQMPKTAERKSVSDPILGVLTPKGDGGWKASVRRSGRQIGFEIGGDRQPDSSLLLHAHDIVSEFPSFTKRIKRFLGSEAAKAPEQFCDELGQLEIEYICLFWPDRPDDGMIFFSGPNDEKRLWRCEYIERAPVGLGYDR